MSYGFIELSCSISDFNEACSTPALSTIASAPLISRTSGYSNSYSRVACTCNSASTRLTIGSQLEKSSSTSIF